MMNKKIGIVILNYLAYQDTLECVESILKQSYQDFKVIIVDNNSSNKSFSAMSQAFQTEERIEVVKTDTNLGFAKGNNLGIKLLQEEGVYNILVINGDTLLVEQDYLEQLISTDISGNVAMIGTRITGRDGANQNTCNVSDTDAYIIKKRSRYLNILRLVYLFHMEGLIRLFHIIMKNKQNSSPSRIKEDTTRVLNSKKEMLHGAALFFTENYLQDYVGFYPDTFLYEEEVLLAYICDKLGFHQMYRADLNIYHKEDSSSDLVSGFNDRKSVLFKTKYQIANKKLLAQVLDMLPEQVEAAIKRK